MSCCESTTQATSTTSTNTVTNCIVDTVKFIYRLQKAVIPTEVGCSSCNNPILGETSRANTRPFILYLPNGEPFELACMCDTQMTSIPVFRVESITGNCAVLRALVPVRPCGNGEEFGFVNAFAPSRTCCTVDLTKFIGIQCLDDCFIPLDICN
ncbi:MAG TPA: hypothetical protein DCY20_11020 [Firmicutes bacterium]|nr:hypothetical protein [Bacillota bacterium]